MKTILRLVASLAVVSVSACATTKRAHSVAQTGFLGSDAARLTPGGPGQAAERYVNPKANFASYTSVLLDPVTVWRDPSAKSKGISAADEQALTNYFYAVIRDALEKQGFQIAAAPGPRTLRAKVAITQAEGSSAALDVVSTVVPSAHALASLDGLVTGKPAFVGEAQVETKVTDSETGELLAAGVDRRVGGKTLGAAEFSTWGQVEAMMRLWAAHGAYRLCTLAHRTCAAPSPSS